MLADWIRIEEIENKNKRNERVTIGIYTRGSEYSFSADLMMTNQGWGTPCMEEPYIYKSREDTVQAAVAFIKKRVEASPSYRELLKTIYKLLPDIEPNLFD
jgi:hypothetical protein